MAHLMRNVDNPSACDICGKNKRTKRIHDREKMTWRHDSLGIQENINQGLKTAKDITQTAGDGTVKGIKSARQAYKGKVGKTTSGALMGVDAAVGLAVGIMNIIEMTSRQAPDHDRCNNCKKTLNTPGCIRQCLGDGGCWGGCANNNWKDVPENENCCYIICEDCFGGLIE